ncbi:MAG: alpha-galactosidase [Clostridia bacterium]|nr:alpha-galactosidase [Clostridia bacterium]
MKRNGMCPICWLKKAFTPTKNISSNPSSKSYDNGAALTPPMGWSSWNTFRNNIDEDLIKQTAKAMVDCGLLDAGYRYLNLDDCWHSSMRDARGRLQGDLTRFPTGIKSLVDDINAMGIKVGIYSSNGTYTCEDLPASLGRERDDALTFAEWGIEFFKYDYCHNKQISKYAPLVESIHIAPIGGKDIQSIPALDALLYGDAKLMSCSKLPCGHYISGLDAGGGKAEFKNVYAPEDGEYALTVRIFKKGRYDKFLLIDVNGEEYHIEVPPQFPWQVTARFQQIVTLKKGVNTVTLSNPVASRADSAMLQYRYMGKMLKHAAETVAEQQGRELKPIIFSICEWGVNKPWKWGAGAGNMWRTTMDIRPWWIWIKKIYNKNVDLYRYAVKGGWNDPDMLEVGNGNLSAAQNVSHFSLWCMMNAPLILGNDLRNMDDEVLRIVTNRNLIAVNQDPLGIPAKRLRKGRIDVLVKPLRDGSAAICFFNKSSRKGVSKLNIASVIADGYACLAKTGKYKVTDMWTDEESVCEGKLRYSIPKDSVKVIKVTPIV